MTGAPSRWDDLTTRIASGIGLAVLGGMAAWAGGVWFLGLAVMVAGLMIWELSRMLAPDDRGAAPLGALAGAVLVTAALLPPGLALPLLLAPSMAGLAMLGRNRATFSVFALLIVVASYGLYMLRQDHGFFWIGWLISVVMVTDIVGYFAGRLIGGPKFWPRVSPKKTWSGTVAGWIGAALAGAVFMLHIGAGPELIAVSVAASMASQIGDIGESSVKRRMGVKDSSSLLPGHGGLLDRFDGMLGAAIFLLLVGDLVGIPPGAM